VVPLIIPELQSLPIIPRSVSIELVDVRGFGSKVQCEFRTSKPLWGKNPAGFKCRFCVLRRFLEIDADTAGTGEWNRVDPEKPIIWEVTIPWLRPQEIVRGVEQAAAIRRAFEKLPGDERAERDSAATWFESLRPKPGELFLPSSCRGVAGNSRDLFFHTGDQGLYVLRDGLWRSGGYCPGWLLDADDTHLYRLDRDWIYVRPIEPQDSNWVRLCPAPPSKAARLCQLRTGAGWLFVTTYDAGVWTRRRDEADAEWVRHPWPAPPELAAVVDGRVVTVQDRTVISRPVAGSEWTPVGPLPDAFTIHLPAGIQNITGWRGQVLARDMLGGPIYARTLDPDDTWHVIGRVGPRPDPLTHPDADK
jgi:hypothetical protein